VRPSREKHTIYWRILCVCLAVTAAIWTAVHVNWQARGKAARISAPMAASRVGERMFVTLPSGSIPVNTAQWSELCQLPGIGPVLAEEIITERQAHGAFYFPEDLLSVRGIGPKKLFGIVDHITLE